MTIVTHNEYEITGDDINIIIDIKRKTRNKTCCYIDGMNKSKTKIELDSEHMVIPLDFQDHSTISIIEKDRRGVEHVIMSKNYGPDVLIVPISNGYYVTYHNDGINIICSKNDLKSFETSFKGAARFNQWMKPQKVWDDVRRAYLSAIHSKDTSR